jgi:hypothetical protein
MELPVESELAGEPTYSKKTCPNATLFTTNPTRSDLETNPDHLSGKSVSNRPQRRDSIFFNSLVGGGIQLGPLGTVVTDWPIVPAPGDYEYGEFGGMKIGKGNRSTRRKPAPAPFCPPQIPLDQTRDRTRAAAVGNQRLTA